jgi:hypothetical protein
MNKERALLLVLLKASICTPHKQLERQKSKRSKKLCTSKEMQCGKKNSLCMKMKIKKLAHKRKVTKKYTCHLMRSYNKPAPVTLLGWYLNPSE